MAAMTSVRLLLASPPSACDVIGLLYVLQFLIHVQYIRTCLRTDCYCHAA